MKADYFAANLPPMLAPNKCIGMDKELPFGDITWPKLCSIKYNGVRGTTCSAGWHSRTGKPLRMAEHIRKMFQPILDYSIEHRVVLDGEFNSTSHNTVGETVSILAGTKLMPDDFKFKCFYELPQDVWNTKVQAPMKELLPSYDVRIPRLEMVEHVLLHSQGEFENRIHEYKNRGLEGWMLLEPMALYKHTSRTTVKEQILIKYKYYSDPEDGKVIGLVPRRERKANVEGRVGVHGKAEQVHTKDSFYETDIAGCMIVELEDGEIIHSPFPLKTSIERREQIHAHFGTGMTHDIKGEWVQFRRLSCENRDKPIAIKGVEFRDSKD